MAVIGSQTLLVFDDLDSFEESWSGVLWTAPQLGMSDFFFMVRLGLWVFGRKSTEVKYPLIT